MFRQLEGSFRVRVESSRVRLKSLVEESNARLYYICILLYHIIYIYVILYAFCLWETNGRVSGQASEAFTLKFWEVGCYVECFIDSNQIQHSFDC